MGACRGCLYVCGGMHEDIVHGEVQRFDPSVGNWDVVMHLLTPRADIAAVSIAGFIYVVGGNQKFEDEWSEKDKLSTVERLDTGANCCTSLVRRAAPLGGVLTVSICGRL